LWSNNSNEYSSVNREIVSEKETDKYFEFKRQNVEYENDILLSRIHKKSYFRPKVDKFKEPDTIGIYNGELSTNRVDELVEYLWSCGSIGLSHSKVIKSQIKEFNDYYEPDQTDEGDRRVRLFFGFFCGKASKNNFFTGSGIRLDSGRQ